MALEALKTGEFPLIDLLIDSIGALPSGIARATNAGLDILGGLGAKMTDGIKNASTAMGSSIFSGPSGLEISAPARSQEISAPARGIHDVDPLDLGQLSAPTFGVGGKSAGIGLG